MNIALIGMMGAGKTTISKLLIQKLFGFIFVDTDEEIVKRENMSINDIFSLKGEDYFRKIESEILSLVLSNDNQIISTGGGIVKSKNNLENLKEKSKVFYLRASVDTLYNRVKNNTERPLLNNSDMFKKIVSLLDERKILYEQAHFIVDTDEKSSDIVVQEIIEKLN